MHEQHRQRMRQKVMENIDILNEHEILEVLLYYAIPRVNTNPIAHKLLDEFGSIDKVLKQDVKMLSQVPGVGESTAVYLKTLGHVLERYVKADEFPTIFSFNKIKEPIRKIFKDLDEEVFIAFFLDSKQRIIGKKVINNHRKSSVEIDLGEFSKQVIAIKPKFVVLAHNHLSGICTPTFDDDVATEKLCLILKLYNANLVEHLIVTDNEIYSYYYHNRIDEIKKKVDSKI